MLLILIVILITELRFVQTLVSSDNESDSNTDIYVDIKIDSTGDIITITKTGRVIPRSGICYIIISRVKSCCYK